MGSTLAAGGLGSVWWLDIRARDRLNDLVLTPDGSGDAAGEHLDVQPVAVDLTYDEIGLRLLAHDHLSHRTCPFDWRKRLTDNVDRVEAKVDEMRAENGGQKVHLVGHSMGGLLIRTALRERPGLWDKIDRVVYIATPHYGSTSIAGYLKAHFWGTELIAALGLYVSRATFRSMWGALGLLPAPAGIYPGSDAPGGHPCANFDLYDPDAYELDVSGEERARLATVLDWVRDEWGRLNAHHRSSSNEQRKRQLAIAGVGHDTLFRLERDGKWFGLRDKRHTERRPGDPHRDGDGRVPVASATLPGIETVYIRAEHGSIHNLPAVGRATFDFLLNGAVPAVGPYRTVAEALADHLAPVADPTAPALGRPTTTSSTPTCCSTR